MDGSEKLQNNYSSHNILEYNVKDKYEDTKRDLRIFIFKGLTEKKYDLIEMKKCVQETFHKSLNPIENAYIERKYMKYCSNLWCEDVCQLVTETVKSKKAEEFFLSLNAIRCIRDVPKVLQTSNYYKLLEANYKLMSKVFENMLIHQIMNICLEQSFNYNSVTKKELEFIYNLSVFLDNCEDIQQITRILDLEKFIHGKASIAHLLNSIANLKHDSDFDISLLKETAESLQKENELTLINKIKEIISERIKPVEIEEKVLDNRCIIEVKCRNLKISSIINDLENRLKNNSDIIEVQFIILKKIDIDSDLKNDIWHGINIVLLARNINIIETVSWDVSGKDSAEQYTADAGVENDGSGKDGSDGHPGESGGNILIVAIEIKNAEKFVIISNGGNGSHGQNGGDGVAGAKGEGISRSDFKKQFPSLVQFACNTYERRRRVKEMIKYIKNLSETIQCEWYTDFKDPGEDDVFIEATTSQGNEITFSYCRGGFTRRFQGFLLYKGSLGKPGKAGGNYGLGGEGGYAGNIEIKHFIDDTDFNAVKHMNKGNDGNTGKVGKHGEHGKNSWDMGYMDYQFWGETVFYDSSDNNIKIVYYENSAPHRIWCPYKDACNRYAYAEMEVHKIEHKKQTTYDNKQSTSEKKDRQHFSRAIKKKNVSKTNLSSFSHIIDLDDSNKLQDLKCQLQNIELRTMQSYTSNQMQERKLATGLKINRISFCNYRKNKKRKHKLCQNIKVKQELTKPNNAEEILYAFINTPTKKIPISKWLLLKDVTFNINQMNLIYTNWENIVKKNKKYKDDCNVVNIEDMFIEKYRIAILQVIAHKMDIYDKNFNALNKNEIEVSADEATKYLNDENDKCSNVHHNVLGSLRQYFVDEEELNRKNIIDFAMKELFETGKQPLENAYSTFFIELSNTETKVDSSIKSYCEDFNNFIEDKKKNVTTYYNIFKSELSKSRHSDILQSLLKNSIDKFLISDIKKEIEKDPFLKILFQRLSDQFDSTFDWNKCLQDKKAMNLFFEYIKQNGPNCGAYRELLAFIFDINIRVYKQLANKKFTLYDNHNDYSKNVIYFLYKDNIFSEITINTDSFYFHKKNKLLNDTYFNTLRNIYSLKSQKELSKYIENYTPDISQNKKIVHTNNVFIENYDEQKDIEKIALFFPQGEKEEIKTKLQKITSNYLGHSGIIHIISKRFENEGINVSLKEMCYLINEIMDSCVKDNRQENSFCWIVATVLQKNWISELVLLQLEAYFMKCLDEKTQLRAYLCQLKNNTLMTFGVKLYQYKLDNTVMSIAYIKDTLFLLSSICDINVDLEDIQLTEWLYVLKEYYWINKLEKSFNWKSSQLGGIPYYILSLENIFGMVVVNEFLDILAQKNMCKNEINTFVTILENFHDERWNLGQDELNQLRRAKNIFEWIEKLDSKFSATDTERTTDQLVELIKCNSNTSTGVLDNLPNIILASRIIRNENYLMNNKLITQFSEEDIKNWSKEFKISKQKNIHNLREQILAIINRAIELRRGFQLRDTQMLTVMSLLANNHSMLAQVSTGEGKSLIVVAVSIMKALSGEKVDVVTSSSVLATRDAICNKDIYDLFQITVSHNCDENIDKRKEAYSNCTVIYGDLSNFQRDYLLDRFYTINILGDHDFSNIIIDEVDSMLLDKGNNMLYLSHDIAGLDKLESVYVYIWCTINKPVQDSKDLNDVWNVSHIKDDILSDMYGIIKFDDIEKLDIKLDAHQKHLVWKFLLNAKILNAEGKLLIQDLSSLNFDGLSADLLYLREHLEFLLRECIERQRFIYVPEYLKPFTERHLESWINSAIAAFLMKAGQDYVVDVDRTKTISDSNPIITILDRDTGTDQTNSQWDEALHQFLQLKHGCKLSMQSLKAVFISNVSYFKLYRKLYGLTGTLGSQRERELLKEVHKVDFVTVPTAKSKKFHENEPVVCRNKELWVDNIYENVKTVVNEEKRSVLIICQSVEDVEFLQKIICSKGIKNIHTYTRDYEEFDIAQGSKKFQEEQVIIATNLAGRGTDIVLTDRLRDRGGLHVCLTYLPSNIRIERQAFGRAARCGDKGTGKLIIIDECYSGGVTSKVLNLKKDRDAEELNRISTITSHYKNVIKTEESCFDDFKTLYEKIKKQFKEKNTPKDLQSILLQCCLDKWAFWLDENSKHKSNNTINKTNFYNAFQRFITQLKGLMSQLPSVDEKCNVQNCLKWVKETPVKIVNLGKYLLNENNFNEALLLFDTVIKEEIFFSETAHYYKAYALSKQINWENRSSDDNRKRKVFKKELLEAARLFQSHSERALNNATLIDKIKDKNSESIIQINAYVEQQHTYSNFYNMYIKSIDDILGSPVTSQVFTTTDIDDQLAEFVYMDLLEERILNQPKIKNKIDLFELRPISRDFGIGTTKLFDFLIKYEGQTIDRKKFINALKKEIKLPSSENFWKTLKEQGILFNEVKYAIIDKEKMRKVDPSFLELLTLKIDSNKLKRPIIDNQIVDACNVNNAKVFANGQCITQQNNEENIILYKDELLSLNEQKYKSLKSKGVFSFNKMAFIDETKIKNAKFVEYDSIGVEDFNKVNISLMQGEEILTELVFEGVLEKIEKRDIFTYLFQNFSRTEQRYKLNVEFDKILEVKLKSRKIYRNSVMGLLFTCFAYRIAIQKLEKQLEERDCQKGIHFQLMTKPHRNLLFELMEYKILKHVKASITKEFNNTEKCVQNLFGIPMSEENFLRLFVKNDLIPRNSASELFNHLIDINWIKHYNPVLSRHVVSKVIKGDLYEITTPDEKRLSLGPSYALIEKSLRNLLDNRSILGNDNSTRLLTNTINQLKSSMKALTTPENNLKPFSDYIGSNKFLNVDELHVMCLNGLDYIQFFEEKKHTFKMKISTYFVFGMGLVQIAFGIIIQCLSVGLMTHVGAAFISEGISDMLYATSAMKSGYFNWNDYFQHKIQSILFSAVTVGIGALISRGAIFSRFGQKLFGPGLSFAQTKATEVAGIQLIEKVGVKIVIQTIGVEALKGIAMCVANYSADVILDRYLKSFCDKLGSTILSNVESKVDNHELSKSLEQTYKLCGENKAKKTISELTDTFFYKHNLGNQLIPSAIKIVSSISRGVTEAAKKKNNTNSAALFYFNLFNKVLVWSNRAKDIYAINTITNDLLNDFNQEINKKNIKIQDKREKPSKDIEFSQEKYETFKKEITDKWKSILRQQAGQVIAQNIVRPLLEECLHKLIRMCGKKVKDIYRFIKESGLETKHQELQKQYKKDIEDTRNNLDQDPSKTEEEITKKYHEDLLQLLRKTKNPKLFAEIVMEKVPMDFTCFIASGPVIQSLLKERGIEIPGLTIVVNAENGVSQEILIGPESKEKQVITLELKGNHYQVAGANSNNDSGNVDNNCLYHGLLTMIPELEELGPDNFRAAIAKNIQENQHIQSYITNGMHQVLIKLSLFGGRLKVEERDDPDSTEQEITDVDIHLVERFMRFFRVGGTIQRISKETNLPRRTIVKGGASVYYDKNSKKKDHQAAHVVRGVIDDQVNQKKHAESFIELSRILGHTQIVPKFANDWHGVGGVVDKFQEDAFEKISGIDFSSTPQKDAKIINSLKKDFVKRINTFIKDSNRLTESQKVEIKNAINTVRNTKPEEIFKSGNKGFSGAYKDAYL